MRVNNDRVASCNGLLDNIETADVLLANEHPLIVELPCVIWPHLLNVVFCTVEFDNNIKVSSNYLIGFILLLLW